MCDIWKIKSNGLGFGQIKPLILELAKMGTREINITGGEPTLNPELLAIIREIRKAGINVSIILLCCTIPNN
jgi:molybdenum cofactor biosynthesis enzyme MoaA